MIKEKYKFFIFFLFYVNIIVNKMKKSREFVCWSYGYFVGIWWLYNLV